MAEGQNSALLAHHCDYSRPPFTLPMEVGKKSAMPFCYGGHGSAI